MGMGILVVDDDPLVAGLLEDILKSDGHRVTTARNGVEALARLTEDVFDLLLVATSGCRGSTVQRSIASWSAASSSPRAG